MKYTKTTRKDTVCNICKKEYPSLSWDHIPPKGGLNLSDMEIRDYSNKNFNPLSAQRDISQNGLKFRTLCSTCNSILGTRYDDCFNSLMKDVKNAITSLTKPSSEIYLKTYPTKIIKSILAHSLGSKTRDCNTSIDNIIRKYLFNEEFILPNDIHVYYWLFPYDCTIIKNDIFQYNPTNTKTHYYSILKSFPLGFIISYECEFEQINELTIFNSNNIDIESEIPLRIDPIYNWDFPESLRYSGVQAIPKDPNYIFAKGKNQ